MHNVSPLVVSRILIKNQGLTPLVALREDWMKVEVHLYATLAKFLPEDAEDRTCWVELAEGEGVDAVMRRLEVPEKSVKLIFINGVHAGKTAALKEGDRVGLFPPVGGG